MVRIANDQNICRWLIFGVLMVDVDLVQDIDTSMEAKSKSFQDLGIPPDQ